MVSGEFLGGNSFGENRHAKGVLYWASGLRHLMRTPDIQPLWHEFSDPRYFVDAVEAYGHDNGIGFVVVGCDSNEFNGMNELKGGMSLEEGVAWICCIGDEAHRRRGRFKMINCNAASYWNVNQANIEDIRKWNDVHAMQNSQGNLDFLIGDRNEVVSHIVSGQRHRQGWDVRQAKEHLYMAADAACRHKDFGYGLTEFFWGNINEARRLLQR